MSKQDWINNVPEEGIDCNGISYKKIKTGRVKDITNQNFGSLTALFRIEIGKPASSVSNAAWLFKCECGNLFADFYRNVKRKQMNSCGCVEYNPRRTDLTDKEFDFLKVLSYAYTKNGRSCWNCECKCGKKIIVNSHSLLGGNTTSCGCKRRKDIKGERFGSLEVIEYSHTNKNTNEAMWRCQCKCGKETIVSGHSLRKGDTKSCGCLISIGENKIEELLRGNNISFQKQFYFKDCRDVKPLPYDFAIFDKNNKVIRLIEYDGIQHFKQCEFFGGNGKFEKRQSHDNIKNNYCKEHNIPLVRIPYIMRDKLSIDILLGSKYLVP